jgi:hypothetical protein
MHKIFVIIIFIMILITRTMYNINNNIIYKSNQAVIILKACLIKKIFAFYKFLHLLTKPDMLNSIGEVADGNMYKWLN